MHTRLPLFLSCLASAGCLWISASEHATRKDLDGDGIPAPEDCNDQNPLIAPGLTEIPCNLTDDDCDPRTADGPAFAGTLTFASVQEALNLAAPGGDITLCAGTFRESLTVLQDDVTLSGNVGQKTVVDGSQGAGATVTVVGGGLTVRNLELVGGFGNDHDGETLGGVIDAYDARGDLVLDSVLVHGGSAARGGGIQGPQEHGVYVLASTIYANTATVGGGGLSLLGGETVIESSTVRDNSAPTGGGVLMRSGGSLVGAGTVVRNNEADSGGGLSMEGGGEVRGIEIRSNTAAAGGGGAIVSGGTFTDVVLAENRATYGGGLAGFATLLRGAVLENVATGRPGGGGLFGDQPQLVLVGVTVADNVAETGDGGGVLAVGPSFLDIDDDLSGPAPVVTTFSRNSAAGRGGGIGVDGATLKMLGGVVKKGTAGSGGGLALWNPCGGGCGDLLQNVVISDNQAGEGGGWWTSVDVTAADLLVTGNAAVSGGGGLYMAAGDLSDTLSTYSGNTADIGGGVYWAGRGTLASAMISQNVATGDGGALMLGEGGNLDCSSVFADTDAGGAAVSGVGGTVDLGASTFRNNADYDFRVCGDPCTSDNPDAPYSGSCTFPLPGCDPYPGYCVIEPTCP